MSNEPVVEVNEPVVQDTQDVTLTPETVEVPVSEGEIVGSPALDVTVAAPPAEQPELIYTYQPTDETGRSLGGKQVIKYRSSEELAQKLTDQNVLLVRKLRETTRKQRLGISDQEQIPDSAPRFDAPVDYTPRVMTSDDRVKLSRDLLDPEKFEEASATLFEATMGAKPEQLRDRLAKLEMNNLRLLAKAESDAFVQTNPDYFRCQDNFETITNWMLKNDLSPVRNNFQLAFETLRAAGLLLEAPNVREEAPVTPPAPPAAAPVVQPTPQPVTEPTPANTQPVQDEPSRITQESSAQSKRPVTRVATGLTRNQAGDAGTTPKSGYTLAEINAMSSDVYKQKLLKEKGFGETVERLEREAQEARRNRR